MLTILSLCNFCGMIVDDIELIDSICANKLDPKSKRAINRNSINLHLISKSGYKCESVIKTLTCPYHQRQQQQDFPSFAHYKIKIRIKLALYRYTLYWYKISHAL